MYWYGKGAGRGKHQHPGTQPDAKGKRDDNRPTSAPGRWPGWDVALPL